MASDFLKMKAAQQRERTRKAVEAMPVRSAWAAKDTAEGAAAQQAEPAAVSTASQTPTQKREVYDLAMQKLMGNAQNALVPQAQEPTRRDEEARRVSARQAYALRKYQEEIPKAGNEARKLRQALEADPVNFPEGSELLAQARQQEANYNQSQRSRLVGLANATYQAKQQGDKAMLEREAGTGKVQTQNPTFAQAAFGGAEIPDPAAFARDNRAAIRAMASGGTINETPALSVDLQTLNKLGYMTDEEVDTYSRYVARGDAETAQRYLNTIDRELNARETQEITQGVSDSVKNGGVLGKVKGVGLNLASTYATPAGALEVLRQNVKNANTGSYEPIDVNSPLFRGQQVENASREALTGNMGNTGRFVADTLLSVGQNVVRYPLGVASLALMGTGAGASTAYQASQEGATSEEAMKLGIVAGAAEVVTEKLPLDEFFRVLESNPASLKEAIANVLRQAGTEFAEETASEYINRVADNVIMGDRSEMEQAVQSLMAEGATREEAERQVMEEYYIRQPLLAGLGGALSGGILGGAGTVYSSLSSARNRVDAGTEALNRAYSEILQTAESPEQAARNIQALNNVARGSLDNVWLPGQGRRVAQLRQQLNDVDADIYAWRAGNAGTGVETAAGQPEAPVRGYLPANTSIENVNAAWEEAVPDPILDLARNTIAEPQSELELEAQAPNTELAEPEKATKVAPRTIEESKPVDVQKETRPAEQAAALPNPAPEQQSEQPAVEQKAPATQAWKAATPVGEYGESGRKTFEFLDKTRGDIPAEEFARQFDRYYRGGEVGLSAAQIRAAITTETPLKDAQAQAAVFAGANDKQAAKGANVIKSYGVFNQRRYGTPWAGAVEKLGKYDFSVGEYTGNGRNGEEGDLRIKNTVEGAVYAYGQKDYRGKSEPSFVVYEDGKFREISRKEVPEAVERFKALQEMKRESAAEPVETAPVLQGQVETEAEPVENAEHIQYNEGESSENTVGTTENKPRSQEEALDEKTLKAQMRALTRSLKKDLGGEFRDVNSVFEDYKQFVSAAILGENIEEKKEELLQSIVENWYTDIFAEPVDDTIALLRSEIPAHPIKITDRIRKSIGNSEFDTFRKKNFPYLRFSTTGDSLDSYYNELSDRFPGLFPKDVLAEADMLELMVELQKSAVRKKVSIWEALRNDKASIQLIKDTIIYVRIIEAMDITEESGGPAKEKAKGPGGALTQNGKAPSSEIADQLLPYLKKGTAFSPAKLFEIANKAYGGTMAEGAYTVKDAYDAMELAVNRYLEKAGKSWNVKNPTAVVRDLEKIQKLLDALPTQTKRTAEMEEMQQFSTPPTISYLAAWAANMTQNDVVLEPSAGVGGLAVWAKAWGAETHVNELSERRLALLNELGFDGVTNLNAEQIDNLLPDAVKPTTVLMNPPFSSSSGRMSSNDTRNAKRHVEQALDRLEEGGRLVAILGRGMSEDAATFKDWWAGLKKEYNVRANVRIDGSNYRKYGTTFDIQMVVIDKTGPTKGTTLTGEFKNLNEIPKALEGIRNDRTRTESNAAVAGREAAVLATDGQRTVRPTVSDGRDEPVVVGRNAGDTGSRAVGLADRRDLGVGAGPDGGTQNVRNADQRVRSVHDRSLDGVSAESRSSAEVGDGSRGNAGVLESGGSDSLQLDRVRVGRGVKKSQAELKNNADNTYTEYVPKKAKVKGAKKHPAKLVESAAMAAVDPPNVTYTPHLSEELVKSGALSDAQLENIIYAGQSHEQVLPDGKRRGYFIGDGTGVGKGRQIAGVIVDNYNQGRKKALWISGNQNLFPDAKRDLQDLGFDLKKVKLLNKFKAGSTIDMDDGVIFAGYDTVKMDMEKGGRLKQLTDWLGKDFDGVIVFDEAHNMAKGTAQSGKRGKTKPSAKALAGIRLQDALPNARVLYASATGAEKVSDYAYLTRLGLWGAGTAFNDVNDFIEKISAGGLAAMELVARDMKAMGVYMARSISYDDVTYDTVEHKLTPLQREIYNTTAKGWQTVFQNVKEALDMTNAGKDGNARGRALGQFYTAQQRFYNQVLTSMAMPTVVESIKKDLADGNSVVLQIVNTNAASADREIAKAKENNTDLEDIDLTPTELLLGYLEKGFPVEEYETYEDERGAKKARLVKDKDGNPVISKAAVRKRDALIARIADMKVPDGPLEILFDAFGPENVAEVTGRQRRLVYKKGDDGEMHRVLESRSPASGLADAQMFQDGKKRILVFSDAGGTGKSYHADLRAKNQQHRVHYLIQAGWSASKALQGFGRTHRSNQASAPTFRLVTTDVMGQKRFTSTIARRLDQLGALTKGQRQAGSGVFSQKDNLENSNASDTLYNFYKRANPEILQKMGLYNKLYDEYGRFKPDMNVARDMSTFLNRILSLEVDEQNDVFNQFYEAYESDLNEAIAAGMVDMGLENYVADKLEVVDEKSIFKDPKTGAETKYVQMTAYNRPQLIPYSELAGRGDYQGLVRVEDGSVRAVYKMASKTLSSGAVTNQYRLLSPVRGKQSTFIQKTLDEKTTPIPKNQAKAAWAEETKKAPKYVETKLHMLTGQLLPVWNKLPADNARVMRVLTEDGTYLGRLIRPDQIDGVLRGFGTNRTKETFEPKTVMERVLKGEQATFQNNHMKLFRSRVSGEYRLEITGDNLWYYRGLFSETIQSKRRYFIPNSERGVTVLNQIMQDNPIVEMRAGAGDTFARRSRAGNVAAASDWETTRAGNSNKKPHEIGWIADKLRHDFGLPIGGPARGNRNAGLYNAHAGTIRTKVANDLPTISHELGHHLDTEYGILEDMPKVVKKEMLGGLTEEIRNLYPEHEWEQEVFAEFVRDYLRNKENTAIDYPETVEYFRGCLPENVQENLDNAADEINAYYSLRAAGTAANLTTDGRGNDFRTVKEKADDRLAQIHQDWVDSNHGISRFGKAAGDKTPYIMATNSAYADSWGYAAINYKLTDKNGKIIGDGMKGTLNGVNLKDPKEYADFNDYLVVRHGPERLKQGKRVFADEVKNSVAWMNNRRAELEARHPHFAEAAEKLYEFQDNVLEIMRDSGLVSAETIKKWKEMYPSYVPFSRVMDKGKSSGARRGFANQDSTIRRAKGSGRTIIHPVEAIVENTCKMLTAANRNNVMRSITDVAMKTPGMGDFLERVETPMKASEYDARNLKKNLKQKIEDTYGPGSPDLSDELQALIDDSIDNFLLQFGRGKPHGDVVTVMKGGKPEFWKVNDPLMLESLVNMNPQRLPAVLAVYGKITRITTGFITGNNLIWNIFSNAPRDLETFLTYSQSKNVAEIAKGFKDAYSNRTRLALGKEVDPMYMEFMALGGGNASAYSGYDPNKSKRIINDLSGKRSYNPLDFVEFVANLIESGPRYAYYQMMRRNGDDAQTAFYKAMDITTNFRRGGINARTLNKFVPFLNANIQGEDKMVRFFTAEDIADKKQREKAIRNRVMWHLAGSALAALLAYLINGRDRKSRENYTQLSNYTKNNFFNIPIGDGQYFAIPKPREIAVLSSGFERALELSAMDNPDAFEGFWSYASGQLLPPVVAELADGFDWQGALGNLGILGTLAYMSANRDFRGNPIVSKGLEGLMPKAQYDQRTTKLAKWIGQAFNVSPKKVDFFLNNTLGGVQKINASLFPIGENSRDLTLGVRNTYIKDNRYSNDIVDRFYDGKDEVDRTYKTYQDKPTELKIAYKDYSNMSTFFSRYSALAKDTPESRQRRATRQTVLDMLTQFNKEQESGQRSWAQRKLDSLVDDWDGTAQWPSVMETTIEVETERGTKAYQLNDSQYVRFQTEYLSEYWQRAETILREEDDPDAIKKAINKAKKEAKEAAEETVLKSMMVKY